MRQKIKEALACPENDIHWYNGEFADCCRALAESASETFASLSQKAAGQTVYGYCSGRMAVIRNEADLVLYKAIVRSMMKSENVPILHQGYFAGPEPRALKMHAALKPEQRVVNARL